MISDRDRILTAIRRQRIDPLPRPEGAGEWIQYPSPHDQFAEVLRAVGGELQRVKNAVALTQAISDMDVYQQAKRRCCELAQSDSTSALDTLDWNVQLREVEDPHTLATLDLAVLPGHFAVAENGAVWVTDRQVRHRAAYFITQHLVLVVAASQIVSNMHEAYERLTFDDNSFGCFISGPSKTADIEQSLVIGAQGARSLTVFFVDTGCARVFDPAHV